MAHGSRCSKVVFRAQVIRMQINFKYQLGTAVITLLLMYRNNYLND